MKNPASLSPGLIYNHEQLALDYHIYYMATHSEINIFKVILLFLSVFFSP